MIPVKNNSNNRKKLSNKQYKNAPRIRNLVQGDQTILHITKNVALSDIVGPTTSTSVFGFLNFKFSDLPEASSFTNVYQHYRFDKVELWFYPTQLLVSTSSGVPYSHPLLVAIDYDNNGTPANLNSVLDYTNMKVIPQGRVGSVTLRPRCLSALYDGTTYQFAGDEDAKWLNTDNTAIVHYGVRYAIKGTGNVYPQTWAVYAKYFCSLRGTY